MDAFSLKNQYEMHRFRQQIMDHYDKAALAESDINEHIPTLSKYAEQCRHIVEFGVRTGVSSFGFANGLLKHMSSDRPCVIDGYDLDARPSSYDMFKQAPHLGFISTFTQANVLHIPPVRCDLLFIDTFHVFGQLRRELARHANGVRKYIILHDTTTDEWEGELRRLGWDATKLGPKTGIPAGELLIGLWPAVMLFLEGHPEWKIKERFVNNNGLTVLERQEV